MELRTRSTVTPDVDVPSKAEDVLDFLLNARPAWHAHAACHDGHATNLDVMFPKGVQGRNGHAADPRAAQKLCRACPVAHECAQAGHNEHHGVWGGVLKDRPRWKSPPSNRQWGWEQYAAELEANPHRWYTASDLAETFEVNMRSAYRALKALSDKGLVDVQPGLRGVVQTQNAYKWKGDK